MSTEDVAIIGMSGRFPGAKNVRQLWENLCLKKESITTLTDEELRENGVSEELLQNPSYVKSGFFLDRVPFFDAEFFDISPREAISMDPQHRFFLECAWEALEDGGYPAGTEPLHVGIFAGSGPMTASYLLEYIKAHPEIQGTSANYHTYGTDKDFFATRASYKLNLTGPCIHVQTACSTSLVSVHLACEAIRRNHCSLALAGGMSIRLPHRKGYLYSEGDIYSKDGRCRTFDADSSGTVFGNGIGLVLLKSLSKALADNDRIYAVIKGSFINNDGGAKPSYPSPGCEGQTACMAQGLSLFGIDPETIQFVESHGTGTVVGDPIEIRSLSQAFGRVGKGRCAIGSIKPNIGHLGGASGVVSLIKMALSLFHKKIPGHTNFTTQNPLINFPNTPFYVNTETVEWPAEKTPRRGAVNSFGVGGTNAFAILEEPPQQKQERALEIMNRIPFTLSAKTKEALEEQTSQLTEYLINHPDVSIFDVAYTLNCGRTHFPYRLFFEASHRDECIDILRERTFSLYRPEDSFKHFKESYLAGASIPWKTIHAGFVGKTVSLPTYPFQGKPYWVEVAPSSHSRSSRIHPLLGWKLDTSLISDDLLFENSLNVHDLHYLKDHVIFARVLFPFTGFLEVFCAAAHAVGLSLPLRLTDIEVLCALELSSQTQIQTKVKKSECGLQVAIYSRDQKGWRLHASAVLESIENRPQEEALFSFEGAQSAADFYTKIAQSGYEYGPAFKTFTDFSTANGLLIGQFKTDGSTSSYTLYPPLLDGVFQLNILARIKSNRSDPEETLQLPINVQTIEIFQPLSNQVYATMDPIRTTTDLSLYNLSGQLVMKIEKLARKQVDRETLYQLLDRKKIRDDLGYHELWEISAPLREQTFVSNSGPRRWVFIGSPANSSLVRTLRGELSKQQRECVDFSVTSGIEGIINFLTLEDEEGALASTVGFYQTYLTTFTKESPRCFTLTNGLYTNRNKIHKSATLVGLHRSMKLEFPDKPLIHIDIDHNLDESEIIHRLMNEFMAPDFEPEISLREEGRFVNRITTHRTLIERNQQLDIPSATHYFLEKGSSIEGLTLKKGEDKPLKDDEVDVAVKAVALNFRDVLNARGLYPGDAGPLGSDFCGEIHRKGKNVSHLEVGQTVFGLTSGAFQNRLIAPSRFVIPKPNELKVTDAASISVVFLTAYYALIKLADLKKGDKVLIHCATGGVGLAAIQIAKQVGAEIFATASSPRKKAYLQSLGVRNVYSSRSLDFVREWKNSQINVVLNSLTGEGFVEGALRLSAPNACFLELSKLNIWTKEQVARIRPDIRYFIVAMDAMRQKEPEKIQELLQETALFFEQRQWTALPSTIFSLGDVKGAFQSLQQAKQIGKVVVKFPNPWRENLSQGTYLITGGFGGLGMAIADWLIKKGAKQLVLVGRTIPQDIDSKFDHHRKLGIQIAIKSCDVTNAEQVGDLFNQLKGLKGIFHTAGVLYNAGFLNHSWQDFERVLAPKMTGALRIHDEIIKHRLDLDFIVYASSIAAVLGGHGATAYAAANRFLDSFAIFQQQMGIAAISMNWGPWGEIGMALPHLRQMQMRGQRGMTNEDALHCLEIALNAQNSNIAVADVDWDLYIKAMASKNPRFSLLRKASPSSKPSRSANDLSEKNGLKFIEEALIKAMRKVLGQPNDYPIDVEESFIKQNLDSLTQIDFLMEIEQGLHLNNALRAHVLQQYPTIASLALYLHGESFKKEESEPEIKAVIYEEAPTFPKIPLHKQKWLPLPDTMKHFWGNYSRNFNIGYAVRFHSALEVEVVEFLFNHVLRQHPIFYLSISLFTPTYKVSEFRPIHIHFMDLSDETDLEQRLNIEHQKSIERPFDQGKFPKLRGSLYKMSESEYELQIVCPHSISDGRSLYLFLKALDDAYTNRKEGRALSTYKTENDYLQQFAKHDSILMENIEEKKKIIIKHLNGFHPFTVRCAQESISSDWSYTKFPMSFRQKFQNVCREIGIEVSLALNGLAGLSLSLITGQSEFSVQFASNGIFSSNFHEMIGLLAKEISLNIQRISDDTLESYINRLKESQMFFSYLREFPSFLLNSPRLSFDKTIGFLEKMIEWRCLPIGTISFLREKTGFLRKRFRMKRSEDVLIKLIVNEIELKKFSNFSACNRDLLLNRGSMNVSSVFSMLVDQEWILYVSCLRSEKIQKQVLDNMAFLIEHFVSNRKILLQASEPLDSAFFKHDFKELERQK